MPDISSKKIKLKFRTENMRQKLFNLGVVITSLIGFMEWGGGNSMFLFEAERELFSNAIVNPASVIHPMTLLPMVGQCILIITLFQKRHNTKLTIAGVLCLGFLFFIGLVGLHFKILFSTLPFLCFAILAIRERGGGEKRDKQHEREID